MRIISIHKIDTNTPAVLDHWVSEFSVEEKSDTKKVANKLKIPKFPFITNNHNFFSLGYWNYAIILTIYGGISCRLKNFPSSIGNKHGFFLIENPRSPSCEAVVLPICVILSQKCGSWTSRYWLQCSSDYFSISQYLKSCDYL